MPKKTAIVLAAGKGTRMKSDLPKVLFPVCGRPMLEYVLDALNKGGVDRTILVVGYRHDLVRETLDGRDGIEYALQAEQLGTGHAVMVCRELIADETGPVLVVTGDAPMMQSDTIRELLEEYDRGQPACILGTVRKDNPHGLGRIVRDSAGRFAAIVEEKDASEEQRQIQEVNMSCYVFHAPDLIRSLGRLRADNAQREYYITDVPGMLAAEGREVRALCVLKPCEAMGINTVAELADVEAAMRQMVAGTS
ncbi:MAG: NTP transferase domain-containing protein [Planctomycetota bacterium]